MSAPSVRNATSGNPEGRRGHERRRPGRPWAQRSSPERGSVPAPPRPERCVATGSSADIGRARMALHAAVGAAGWAVFVGLWVWQLEVYVPAEWLAGTLLLVAIALAYAVLTPAWVWWNRSIYRRRHRRRTPIVREVAMEHDTLGRRLLIAPEVLLNPVEVRVTVDADGSVKRYDVPLPAAAAAPEPQPVAEPHEEARSA